MRIMLAAAALFFCFSLAARLEGQTRGIDPDSLTEIVGLTETEVLALRSEMVATHARIQKLQERASQASDSKPIHQEMVSLRDGVFEKIGAQLTPKQRTALSRVPTDEKARAHYWRSRVLTVPGMSGEQRQSLEQLLAAMRAAPQNEHTEARFWTLCGLILEPAQMRTLKTELPYRFQTRPRPDNYFALTDLDPALGNRVLSAFRNLESETTANRVRAQQIEASVEGGEPQPSQMEEMMKIQRDMCELRDGRVEELRTFLSEAQQAQLDSCPPHSSFAQQRELAEWLCSPERQTQQQRELSVPRLMELQKDWKSLESEVKSRSQGLESPESRGGMTAMLELRELVKPLEARRLAISRDIAPLMSRDQVEQYINRGVAD